ncbi:hypothetical protein GE21DRAFT_9525 [Neurospora crassa]|uniref:Uncharacterized protein n=1 Tax=Neurospora crassa (strain ATCC 24698 / 74-OR23-1A / CBS 708.71 / DSM 1257 / FGSC 987) TaxID=367110 RepID=V5IKV5_NEUCR|nr:hypothetical protein NCU17143 [Neurospora crassa OR74A]ESA42313.1 hypothetical protein NCU17143 [Neurospora crassa OR74A]KHE83870.1 hypothetical protein GE21DRAFT_9525 [Neurospora crassa]|eukprot:XP_011395106.1 hypothetical protein NCU17143 [Neurospora crassa OR74A]
MSKMGLGLGRGLESYYTSTPTYHPSGAERVNKAGDIPTSNPFGLGSTISTNSSNKSGFGDKYGSLITSTSGGEGGSLGLGLGLGSESQTISSTGTSTGAGGGDEGGGEEKK